jgi:hypothetical protein
MRSTSKAKASPSAVLLRFSCPGFALLLFLQVCSLSPYRREPFLWSASLGQGAVLDRQVFVSTNVFIFLSST